MPQFKAAIFAVFVGALTFLAGCAGHGSSAAPDDHDHADHKHEQVKFRPDMDVVVISENGEAVTVADHLVPGKVTVVDYGAEWCHPCKDVDSRLFELLDQGANLAVRKIDVGDWESEVAQKHLKDVPQLPYVLVYDRSGKQVDAISGLDLDRLNAAIQKGMKE
jgi:thiol-disulfide isomerase/thioredoxin